MKSLKFLILTMLSIPILNTLLRLFIHPIKGILPIKKLMRIPVVGQVLVKYADLNAFVMVADGKDTIASRIYWMGTDGFQASETNVYRALLNDANTILDIGANTGLYTLIAGVHSRPTKIYSFEPMPIIATMLLHNVNANHLNHAQVFEIALSDIDGDITLYVPVQPTLPVASSTAEDFRQNTKPITVQAMRLDSFVAEHQIEKVDLMKIDTESTEPAVLRGGSELIKRDRPLIMCEILSDKPAQMIAEFFEKKDYQIYRIEDAGIRHLDHIKTQRDATNFFFIPSEKQHLVPQHLIVSD
jgi:FkbM family methyltransferase